MTNIIVIGGGITGSLITYFLARNGIPATLIENSGIGEQASGQNPGGLNPLHGPCIPGTMSEFALRSFRLHQEHLNNITKLSGLDYQWNYVSRIEVAFNNDEITKLHNMAALYNNTEGFSATYLDQQELLQIEPTISDNVVAGLLLKGNVIVNGHTYTVAAAEAARSLGASVIDANVSGLKHDGARVTGVQFNDETLDCDAVILATGPWASEADKWLGKKIAVMPVKGELLLVDMQGQQLNHHFTRSTMGIYNLPQGKAMLGGTWEQAGFNVKPTQQGYDKIINGVAEFMPCIREAKIERHMAALRPVTQDGLPILGKISDFDNAFVATGAGSKGMLLATGMAESIVNLVSREKPGLPLDQFSPERFQ